MKLTPFLFLILLSACYHEDDYKKPYDESLLQIQAASSTVPADGVSTTLLTITIPTETEDTSSGLTLTTSTGTFVENGQKTVSLKAKQNAAGTKRSATVLLKAGLAVETATVTVEALDFKKTIDINFINAFPESLTLTASTLSVQPINTGAGEVAVEGQVRRSKGIPSLQNEVDVRAMDSVFAKRIGSFRVYQNHTNESGKTNYVFILGDSVANSGIKYKGTLYLIGSTFNEKGTLLSDTIKIISSQ